MPALPLNDKMVESVAQRFRLLGEPMRLRILQVLEHGEKTVGEIVAALDGNQPNISSHLRALWGAGLLKRRRSGTNAYYSIADPTIFKLCDLVCRSATREARAQLAELVPQRRRTGASNS
jgi:DNA-binding transcriptional ArsR family regulator